MQNVKNFTINIKIKSFGLLGLNNFIINKLTRQAFSPVGFYVLKGVPFGTMDKQYKLSRFCVLKGLKSVSGYILKLVDLSGHFSYGGILWITEYIITHE